MADQEDTGPVGSAMRDRDVRVQYYRDSSVHWRGHGEIIHLPTGISVGFDIAWNDRSAKNRAMADLRRRVAAALAPPTEPASDRTTSNTEDHK